jgi:hypothetical protein
MNEILATISLALIVVVGGFIVTASVVVWRAQRKLPPPKRADKSEPVKIVIECDNTQCMAALEEVRLAAEATGMALAAVNAAAPKPGEVMMDSTGCNVCGRPWVSTDLMRRDLIR